MNQDEPAMCGIAIIETIVSIVTLYRLGSLPNGFLVTHRENKLSTSFWGNIFSTRKCENRLLTSFWESKFQMRSESCFWGSEEDISLAQM
ncbi:hypothetical protein Y032_0065g3659 [Ancylostoma ceylanicum]|uniref:Uncharacterized protein n=1 Tax=Ancylostoma ceylanicum TaxID=53326 RepID=A0A016U1B1_9BILA|nr:hypothetical protein Y032_0065g3659 [Ancylostoma ceylanicum]